jgi:hypothetical protein
MFDRGFGKATQPVEGSLTYGISERLAELFKGNEDITPGVRLRVVRCRHRMASSPTDEDQPSRARSRLLHGAISPKERPRSGLLEKFAERGPSRQNVP